MLGLAIEVAVKGHQNQERKGTDIPYITHPLPVGIILANAGCADDVIVAGILHDTLEGTPITLDYIQETFGSRVASIVKGASEPDRSLRRSYGPCLRP
jgi:(p)ppGpp synthase/HD superfamily hydrolase